MEFDVACQIPRGGMGRRGFDVARQIPRMGMGGEGSDMGFDVAARARGYGGAGNLTSHVKFLVWDGSGDWWGSGWG